MKIWISLTPTSRRTGFAILPGADADDDAAILSWSYSLENVPQGTHSMQIRVHDTVSDGVTFDEGTNPNYAELAVTEFIS